MGLDFVAISKARLVPCRGDDDCPELHLPVGPERKRKDGLRAGCYVPGKGGRSCGFSAGSYADFDMLRQELCRLAIGVEPEDVWGHPRRYRGRPFVEFIDFPDEVGGILGPKTSAKLFDDFAVFANEARRYFMSQVLEGDSVKKQARRRRTEERQINCAGLLSAARLVRDLGATPIEPCESDNCGWMWETYRDFRRAFKLARDRGFVRFT